ncbi:hypothetical protein S40285_06623 [Stachybotrys chlorohalonatus IBT 40285]|uniref:Uncharacterized protein n=1 Tax=Stachybotrys chlorohalonatus (strain IBT 40285) TaxID=1283841 RepID=A0A084R1Q2_STAC4|nr:hypothetical protein S40285_06623 [Stachybotrys chlorohalonata IBT 40285]
MVDLLSYLPWTIAPLISNAPMGGYANGALAGAVSLAGGLGFIGSIMNMTDLSNDLRTASEVLATMPTLKTTPEETLQVGVGLLPFVAQLDEVIPVIAEYKPAVVWLFSPQEIDDFVEWTTQLRAASPASKIWIQVGSVEAALYVARTAEPDALCMQGIDAGGHGYAKGAGIISLIPETQDTLSREGYGNITLIASGGIADGRGVASALTLGAEGVVLGTRFLASREVTIHPTYQAAILEAQDGGQVTVRSTLFDELSGPSIWPEVIDGRSLAVQSYVDFENGVPIEEIQRLHAEAVAGPDRGFATGLRGRAAIWAGTGVGLVDKVQGAGDIVKSVRSEAKKALHRTAQKLPDC